MLSGEMPGCSTTESEGWIGCKVVVDDMMEAASSSTVDVGEDNVSACESSGAPGAGVLELELDLMRLTPMVTVGISLMARTADLSVARGSGRVKHNVGKAEVMEMTMTWDKIIRRGESLRQIDMVTNLGCCDVRSEKDVCDEEEQIKRDSQA